MAEWRVFWDPAVAGEHDPWSALGLPAVTFSSSSSSGGERRTDAYAVLPAAVAASFGVKLRGLRKRSDTDFLSAVDALTLELKHRAARDAPSGVERWSKLVSTRVSGAEAAAVARGERAALAAVLRKSVAGFGGGAAAAAAVVAECADALVAAAEGEGVGGAASSAASAAGAGGPLQFVEVAKHRHSSAKWGVHFELAQVEVCFLDASAASASAEAGPGSDNGSVTLRSMSVEGKPAKVHKQVRKRVAAAVEPCAPGHHGPSPMGYPEMVAAFASGGSAGARAAAAGGAGAAHPGWAPVFSAAVDAHLMRRAIALADAAVEAGNHPFGALLVRTSAVHRAVAAADGDDEGGGGVGAALAKVLAGPECTVAEGQNEVNTKTDSTLHAETGVISAAQRTGRMRRGGARAGEEVKEGSSDGSDGGGGGVDPSDVTLVTSTEPCAMCCGALYWSGIRNVIYGCSEVDLAAAAGDDFLIPSRSILENGNETVLVRGPVLGHDASKAHQKYWPALFAGTLPEPAARKQDDE